MGGLHYPSISNSVTIGTKSDTTRIPIDLESTYQTESGQTKPTKSFSSGGYSKMNMDLLYTMGATETTNSIEIKIEGSSDNTNWYRIANDATSGGTSTLTAREFTFVGVNAAATNISFGLDIFYKHIRVSIKETGVVTNKGTIYGETTLLGK